MLPGTAFRSPTTLRHLGMFAFVSVLAACATKAKFDPAAECAKLLRRDAEWPDLASAGKNVDSIVSYWSDDAVVLEPGQPAVEGKAAISQLWGAFLPILEELTLDTTFVDVSGDLAYGTGTFHMKTTPGAPMPAEDRGKYVVIYRRQSDGGWKAVVDMFSSNGPA